MKAGPKHAPRVPFALLVVALIVGGLVTLLALNTASAANELRRHEAALRDATVAAQLEQLRNQVAASEAPGNLAAIAAQLGMVPGANPAFLEIGADGRVSVLGSPAPATAAPVAAPSTPHPTTTPSPTQRRGAHPSGAKSSATASAGKSAAPTPSPSPTPSPTATSTLPGGPR